VGISFCKNLAFEKPENPCIARFFGFSLFCFSIDFAEHMWYNWGTECGTILSLGGRR